MAQMPLAKRRDAVVVGMLVAGQHAKGHVLGGLLLHLARRRDAERVTVTKSFATIAGC
jgi:cytochrome P450